MMIEMLYHLTLNSANGPMKQLFGFAVDTTAADRLADRRWRCWRSGALGFWRTQRCVPPGLGGSRTSKSKT